MVKIREKPVIFRSTKDGNALWGVLSLPQKRGRFPAVIVAHGFCGTKSKRKFVEFGRVFAQNGIAVLRFDFSGCGDSEGKFENMSVSQQVGELADAYDFLKKQPKIDMGRIGFLGHSLGALIVCLLVGDYPAFKAKTLVLLAPALDQKSLIKIWNTPRQIKRWKEKGYLDMPKCRIGVKYLNEAKDFTPIASKIQVPVMVIHGSRDEDVPLEFGRRVFNTLGGERTFQIIKGADHDFESHQASEQLISLSLERFKNYL